MTLAAGFQPMLERVSCQRRNKTHGQRLCHHHYHHQQQRRQTGKMVHNVNDDGNDANLEKNCFTTPQQKPAIMRLFGNSPFYGFHEKLQGAKEINRARNFLYAVKVTPLYSVSKNLLFLQRDEENRVVYMCGAKTNSLLTNSKK
jgi:hypothetical protein